MPSSNRLPLVALALASFACGGAEPPPVAPSPAPAPSAPPPAPPPDLSAVPAPTALVVSGRLAKPSDDLAMAKGWAKLPVPGSEQVSELLTSEAVGAVVDLDQPIDFAVAVAGSGMRIAPIAAVSAAVKDPEKVRASFADRYKLVPGDNGVTLVSGLGKGRHAEDDDEGGGDAARFCELAPAFGAAPVRIVCGWGKTALKDLGPWLTRTAPRTPGGRGLHVDVRMEPLRATLVAGKGLAGALFGGALGSLARGPAVRDLAAALGGDLADLASDLDTAAVDVAFTPAGAEATASMHLSGHASTLGQLASAHAEKSGPPPAALWQMPADADLVFFERGVDDAPLSRGRDLGAGAVGAWLESAGVSPADAKAVGAAAGKLATGAPVVYASGLDVPAVRAAAEAFRALGREAPPAKLSDGLLAWSEALLGWRLIEIDEPSAAVNAALRQLSASMGKGSIAAALHAKDKNARPVTLRLATPVRATGLPAGTTHWALEVPRDVSHVGKVDPKKPAPVARPVTWHVLVASDAGHTWLGVGGDEAALATRLAGALGAGASKLAGRDELAFLRDARVGAAWAVSPRGLLDGGLAWSAGAGEVPTNSGWRAIEDLSQTPSKGEVAAVVTVTAEPSGVRAGLRLPKGAIEDVVTEMIRAGGW